MVDRWLPDANDNERQRTRKEMKEIAQDRAMEAKRSRRWIKFTPLLWMAVTTIVTWCWLEFATGQSSLADYRSDFEEFIACIAADTDCGPPSQELLRTVVEGGWGNLSIFFVVSALVVLAYSRFFDMPSAYRTRAAGRDDHCAERQTALFVMLPVLAGWILNYCFPGAWSDYLGNIEVIVDHLILLSLLATTAYTYRWRRFVIVKKRVGAEIRPAINYDLYANHP